MRATVFVSHPAVPPSYNAFGRSAPRGQAALKREWQQVMGVLLMEGKLPRPVPGGQLYAEATLRFTQMLPRDEGNFRVLLEKALGDALVAGGWLTNDTAEHYRFGPVSFMDITGLPHTWLALSYDFRDVRGERSVGW